MNKMDYILLGLYVLFSVAAYVVISWDRLF